MERREPLQAVRISGRGRSAMIRQIDKSHFTTSMSSHPKLHRELMWYATDDDAVLGVVILDLVDKDYSWVVR